jgi:hypothetical protein
VQIERWTETPYVGREPCYWYCSHPVSALGQCAAKEDGTREPAPGAEKQQEAYLRAIVPELQCIAPTDTTSASSR